MKTIIVTESQLNKLTRRLNESKEPVDEGKTYSDENFEKFAKNAGMWLYEVAIDNPFKVTNMSGYSDFKRYIKEFKNFQDDQDIIGMLPDYFEHWINEMNPRDSNRIMGQIIRVFNFEGKMMGKEVSGKRGRPRKEKPVDAVVEPSINQEPIDSLEKRKRGRPPISPELRKPKQQTKDDRIKYLEDKIKSLEDVLRNKGLMEEEKKIYKAQLRMVKDYRKFL